MDKTTPVKHDHNTDGQNNTSALVLHRCQPLFGAIDEQQKEIKS
jgi:hypothetical protein